MNNLLSLMTDGAENRELYTRMVNERIDLMRKGGVDLHPQDARDYHAMSRLLDQFKPDVIVHLAAVSHAGKSRICSARSITACERSRTRST